MESKNQAQPPGGKTANNDKKQPQEKTQLDEFKAIHINAQVMNLARIDTKRVTRRIAMRILDRLGQNQKLTGVGSIALTILGESLNETEAGGIPSLEQAMKAYNSFKTEVSKLNGPTKSKNTAERQEATRKAQKALTDFRNGVAAYAQTNDAKEMGFLDEAINVEDEVRDFIDQFVGQVDYMYSPIKRPPIFFVFDFDEKGNEKTKGPKDINASTIRNSFVESGTFGLMNIMRSCAGRPGVDEEDITGYELGEFIGAMDQPGHPKTRKEMSDVMKVYLADGERVSSDSVSHCTMVQIYRSDITSSDADSFICEAFLNMAIPAEMSRAVPFLDVSVLAPLSTLTADGRYPADGFAMSMEKWLGDMFSRNPYSWNDSLDSNRYKFALTKIPGSSYKMTNDEGKPGPNMNIAMTAGSEIFLSPQTMVNAPYDSSDSMLSGDGSETGAASMARQRDFTRPFLSVESFNLEVSPSEFGLMASSKGMLRLRLHDISKMKEIAPLINNNAMQNTFLRINFGWSHPLSYPKYDVTEVWGFNHIPVHATSFENDFRHFQDGSKGAFTNVIANEVGELIGAQQVTKDFRVVMSDFSVDGSEVQINLSLVPAAERTAQTIDIANFEGGPDWEQLTSMVRDIKERVSQFNKVGYKEIELPSTVSGIDSASIFNVDKKQKKALKKFLNKLRTRGIGEDLRRSLVALFNSNKIEAMKKSRAAMFNDRITALKRAKDPFLCNKGYFKNFTSESTFCSLGHLIGGFVGRAINELYNPTDSLLVFEPFNMDAGGAFDRNIAQFPIKWTDIEKEIRPVFEKNSKVSLQSFMVNVLSKLVNIQGAPAYGVGELKQTKKTTDKQVKAFQARQERSLSRIYTGNANNSGKHDTRFVVPRVVFQISDAPTRHFLPEYNAEVDGKRSYLTEKSAYRDDISRTIRILFRDSMHVPNKIMQKMQESSGRPGHVFRYPRRDEKGSLRPMHIQPGYVLTYQEKLKAQANIEFGLIGDSYPDAVSVPEKMPLADIGLTNLEGARGETYMIKDVSADRKLTPEFIKSIVKPMFSTVEYATEASGILEARLQSQGDSDKATMEILEAEGYGKKDKKAKTPSGLPMQVNPFELELTTFGCPFFNFGQQYYFDFHTGTSMDALYRIGTISHDISPGQFKTSITAYKSNDSSHYESIFAQTADQIEQINAETLKKLLASGEDMPSADEFALIDARDELRTLSSEEIEDARRRAKEMADGPRKEYEAADLERERINRAKLIQQGIYSYDALHMKTSPSQDFVDRYTDYTEAQRQEMRERELQSIEMAKADEEHQRKSLAKHRLQEQIDKMSKDASREEKIAFTNIMNALAKDALTVDQIEKHTDDLKFQDRLKRTAERKAKQDKIRMENAAERKKQQDAEDKAAAFANFKEALEIARGFAVEEAQLEVQMKVARIEDARASCKISLPDTFAKLESIELIIEDRWFRSDIVTSGFDLVCRAHGFPNSDFATHIENLVGGARYPIDPKKTDFGLPTIKKADGSDHDPVVLDLKKMAAKIENSPDLSFYTAALGKLIDFYLLMSEDEELMKKRISRLKKFKVDDPPIFTGVGEDVMMRLRPKIEK